MDDGRAISLDSSEAAPLLIAWNARDQAQPPITPFQRLDVTRALHLIYVPHRTLGAAWTGSLTAPTSLLAYSRSTRRVGIFPLRLLEGPVGYHASVVDFSRSGGERADRSALMALLASDGWDLLEFRGVAAESALAHAAAATNCAIVPDNDSHLLPLDAGPIMSPKHGRNLRRLLRRLEQTRGGRLSTCTPHDPEWHEVVEAFATLHIARWSATRHPSDLGNPATRGRWIEILTGARVPSGLGAMVLRVGDLIGGVILSWDDGQQVHAWRMAYDAALAPFSPGLQLVQALAESVAERGRSALRLGRGDDQYKASWTTKRTANVIIRAVRPGLPTRVVETLGRLTGRAPLAGWRS